MYFKLVPLKDWQTLGTLMTSLSMQSLWRNLWTCWSYCFLNLHPLVLSWTFQNKKLTNACLEELCFAEVARDFMQILHGEHEHKYFGFFLMRDLVSRTNVEFDHRLHAAWAKISWVQTHHFKQTRLPQIEIEVFRFVVSPTATFGLAVLPLTKIQIHKLDVVQRRMLRSIFGRVRTHNEQWQDTMQRMNGRFEFAMTLHPVCKWSDRFFQSPV